MKKQYFILPAMLIALIFSACSDYINTGTGSDLTGTWDIYSITQKNYTNGSLDTTIIQNDVGTFTFNSSGDGNYSIENEDETQSGTFEWFEKNDKVFLNMMNLSDSVMTKNLAIGFDVETSTSTQQVWSLTYSYYEEDENPSTGYTVNYLKKTYMEIDLRKQ